MRRAIYKLFIAPRQQDEDTRNRELVLNVLLSGMLLLAVITLLLLLGSYFLAKETYVAGRIVTVAVVVVFLLSLFGLSRRGHFRTAALLLVGVHFLLANLVLYKWGIVVPAGVLLDGLVIVLAGILLGPRYSLYVAGAAVVCMMTLEVAASNGWYQPDLSWITATPTFSDAISFGIILAIIALISWLFNAQMERSLHRAQRAENALRRQKGLLETTVDKRTRQLQAAQLEKVQQMYRFAELGQLSTALLHELANHLASLTLDIEGLGEEDQHSGLLKRARRSIRYMDEMVLRVRDQLRGKARTRLFAVTAEIDEVVSILSHKASEAHVRLRWLPSAKARTLRCRGEPIRFRQLMANVISNAIDAYDPMTLGQELNSAREVQISLEPGRAGQMVITVNDWGRGIVREDRAKLFEPLFSTKKTGMGMGLFVAKQIAEGDFRGSIKVDNAKKHTSFVITLASA